MTNLNLTNGETNMEKYIGEKQQRFSFRKLSVGLVSAAISSLFFMSVLETTSVQAQETIGVHYKYVTDTELTLEEKGRLVYAIPTYVENGDDTYYLVYQFNSQNQLEALPNTGSKNDMQALISGAGLATLGILIFSFSKKKVKNKTVLNLVLVAGIGNGLLLSAHALENNLLLNYNTDYELTSGEKLPLPKEISGYTYIGYIKEKTRTTDLKASDQHQSSDSPTNQPKIDYTVAPNFVETPPKAHSIQEKAGDQPSDFVSPSIEKKNPDVKVAEKPSSKELKEQEKAGDQPSDFASPSVEKKNPDVKVAEKPSSKELKEQEKAGDQPSDFASPSKEKKNPDAKVAETPSSKELSNTEKEDKKVSDSQSQLTEDKHSEAKKEETPSSKEKTGVNTLNPQDEVLSGRLQKPELLYRDESIETKIDFQEEILDNPDLAEGTVRVRQEGTLGKKIEVVRIFSVNNEEVSREILSTSTIAPVSRIVERGTKKVELTKEEPDSSKLVNPEKHETTPGQTQGQAGAIVEPKQVAPLPEDKGNIEQVKPETPTEKPKEKEPEKTLELRNVSDVELYSRTDGAYKQHVSLDKIPDKQDSYFVKVKSSTFKDVYLPVASIVEATKDSQSVYKITAQAEKLQQELENKYVDNFTFYLAKKATEEKTNFTSFSNLVKAINQNPDGTYHLGASLNANEVELDSDAKSYIKGTFTGKLIGNKEGKHYAIYNLKKPLFDSLSGATVENLSLKGVTISGKNDIGSLANEAQNGTKINQVHVDGVLAGEGGIGGLLAKANQSTITNSSFKGRLINTYETTAAYNIGGLVGHLSGINASIDKSKTTITISSNANQSNQTVGGLAGLVDKDAHISNSYAEGDINNVKRFGKVAGVAGYLWDKDSNDEGHSGRLTNVLSDVNVTNGNAITGYHFRGMRETEAFSNKSNRVYNVTLEKDEVVTKESLEERGTVLDASQIASKKAEISPLTLPTVEPLLTSANKESDFSKVEHYQASRALVYKNIEKLLPFYNKATIVKYGNLVKENSHLYTKELLSAVMMKDDQVITDLASNKQSANKLLLHYQDHSSERLDLKYLADFAKLAEYSLGDTGLIYTPNQFLYNRDSIIQQVLPELQQVEYQSDAVRNTLGISSGVKLTELYLEEQFAKTRASLEDSLKKLLSADAGLASDNQVMSGYIVDKIKRNKEALLLGLSYLERWYNFSYDKVNIKDIVMYHLDFFGKGNASPLDTLIELGKSGFNNLLAKNNVDTYSISLASHHGTKDLFSTLENYRKVFLPNKTNNDWFKSQTKAYIVEEKSNIPEVRANQEKAGSKYSIGVYDRITSDSWKYRNMLLPLLTLPEKSIFVISTISSLGFGAYDRYRNSEHKAGEELNKFVEENARETAKRHRTHYDYWYRILDTKGREKLYRNILLYDAYKFGDDNTSGKATVEANFDSSNPAMKNFFGPVGNKVVHNHHGAYATGDAVYYMSYRMLDKDGAITYTHEMTHDSDQDIYLGGYGRRSGLGPEFFAKGLLQAPDHPTDATITVNSILKHSKTDSTEGGRLQVLDPTERFKDATDLQTYVHNMFDVIYMLEYLEGKSVLELNSEQKQKVLRKITNVYKPAPDGNSVYATNVIRTLTNDEVNKLTTFESLIENDIVSEREYDTKEYERNGYFTIKLFSPIYSALSSENGTPGDLMGRRIAYELLAAKGFKEGMVPYISNQYEEEAKQKGKTINLYGKTRGLVTDDLVLEKVFKGQYKNWVEFKKAMYQERQDQFDRLNKVTFKDPTQSWQSLAKKTITSVSELQTLMNEAVRKDADAYRWYNYNPDIDSAVHKLKKAIFKAYLDQTDDFRNSIFENRK